MVEKILTIFGSFAAVIASIIGLMTGQLLLAMTTALLGTWGFWSLRKRTAFDEVISSNLPAPGVEELKRFRKIHPNLSFSEAIVHFQKTKGQQEG